MGMEEREGKMASAASHSGRRYLEICGRKIPLLEQKEIACQATKIHAHL